MGFFLVLKAELVRSLIIMRRYWFAALTGMLFGYGMLIGLIYAFASGDEHLKTVIQHQIAPSASTQTATSTPPPEVPAPAGGTVAPTGDAPKSVPNTAVVNLLGFLIGGIAFSVVGMFSQGLSGMAQSGELEQLCMSPHGLVGNFLARVIVSSISSIITSSILLALIAATVHGTLYFSLVPTVTLLALTVTNLLGFGFMVGGLTLVFKQTGQVAMIVRMVLLLLPLAVDKMDSWPLIARVLAHILPITDAAVCLRGILLDNQGFAVFAHQSFYLLLVSCVIWTTIGIACFKYMENWSRDKGTLGVY